MLYDFGRAHRTELKRPLEAKASRLAHQETGCEQVAGARSVDQLVDGFGNDVGTFAVARCEGAVLASSDNQRFDAVLHGRNCTLKMRNAGKCFDFGLVGEKDVDPAIVQQFLETVAVALDAKDVGQREGYFPARLMGHLDRSDHRVSRRLRVPQIAL